ncbi:uncharacterized protein LOC133308374 [Gastrolobium bilobum]|uniref:uncharacterized protein LOC133308374 n=1 Tax=Gastrolobium bilobum TaxID=150636 RepID=UPI002AB26D99|nr:uncharacterized protein LOC133308374 [Gastrolobium bilobum]
MADNTRMRELHQRLETLKQQFRAAELVREQQHTSLQDSHLQLHTSQQQLQDSHTRFHQDLARLIELNTNNRGILGSTPQGTPPPVSDNSRSRHVKLDFPHFASGDPTTWIICVERYFAFYQVPLPDRLNLAAFHLDEPAASWFYGSDQNGLLIDWRTFCTALHRRFGPSEFDDPAGALAKIQQTGSVLDYQSSFEKLVSKVTGLSATLLRSIFISGLKSHIRRSVLTLRPQDYHEAFSLARVYEDQANENRSFRSWSTAPKTLPSTFTTTTNTPIPVVPIRRLSPEEMQLKREKNLCYNCNVKYSFGHKCKGRAALLYFEGTDDDPGPDVSEPPDPPVVPPPFEGTPEISFNALFGHHNSRSFRLTGAIKGKSVQILVDGGSTHNFITARMAIFLDLTMQHIPPFQVQVGNGDTLQCTATCVAVPLFLQSNIFSVDLFVLDLKGADVVLGIQWLSTLGPIVTDYSHLTMSFTHNSSTILLHGDQDPRPSQISNAQLHKMVAQNSVSSCFMCLTSQQPTQSLQTPLPTQSIPIQQILSQFQDVFNSITSLPPDRPSNHHINLLPNSKPVQVRPYRYPHFQKTEIEKMVNDMLTNGIIQPSHSPFSSPVLLVRKKDGTWRFCVDYRALNAITIPDKFPIPTVDELLDELHGAQIFSKLDLRSGYHQIKMAPIDVHKTAFRTHSGHFEFLVMPFGLSNAPSTFQATMNHVFNRFLRRFVVIFFDDILVYSSSLQAHSEHLVQEIQFLGHIISAQGVSPDPSKIQAVKDWPTPKSVTELRAFLGLSGYYRRFIRGYATVAAPSLTYYLQMPLDALPNFTLPFVLETDASGAGIGAVLLQENHPIAYYSRKLSKHMQAKSTYFREMHAITSVVAKWRQYLLGSSFVIKTDHKSLHHLMSQVIQTPDQQQFLAKLLGFNYSIQYKPGKLNVAADALSRQPEGSVMCLSPDSKLISYPTSQYSPLIQSELQKDSYATAILHDLQRGSSKWPHWHLHQFPSDLHRTPPVHVPAAFVGHRSVWKNGKDTPQVLVQWRGLPPEESTWEDESLLAAGVIEKVSPLPHNSHLTQRQRTSLETEGANETAQSPTVSTSIQTLGHQPVIIAAPLQPIRRRPRGFLSLPHPIRL